MRDSQYSNISRGLSSAPPLLDTNNGLHDAFFHGPPQLSLLYICAASCSLHSLYPPLPSRPLRTTAACPVGEEHGFETLTARRAAELRGEGGTPTTRQQGGRATRGGKGRCLWQVGHEKRSVRNEDRV
eukprot:GHVU01222680.1.p2 GENE.GHVU01222680.1~~GHVU01222680.1.p2  ORF type:complete len:128 (+),score=6.12 GHVU01222680.1:748-1131(+)